MSGDKRGMTKLLLAALLLTSAAAANAADSTRNFGVSGFDRVRVDGAEVDLSRREYLVLEQLLRAAPAVVGKEELLDAVWASGEDANVVEVYVGYLRRKLGRERIETVRLRRSPKYSIFLLLGAALGIVVALILTVAFNGTQVESPNTDWCTRRVRSSASWPSSA